MEITRTIVTAKERKIKDIKFVSNVYDLPREEYIEYMQQVFEDAKDHVKFGRTSVNSDGSIAVVGWGCEEELTKNLIEEINKKD